MLLQSKHAHHLHCHIGSTLVTRVVAVSLYLEDDLAVLPLGSLSEVLLQGRYELSVGQAVIHQRGKGGVLNADAIYCGIVEHYGHSVSRHPHVKLRAIAAEGSCLLERCDRVLCTAVGAPVTTVSHNLGLGINHCAQHSSRHESKNLLHVCFALISCLLMHKRQRIVTHHPRLPYKVRQF